MEKIDIACGPVNAVPQVAGDPHTLAREMITQVKHTQAGMLRVVNSPWFRGRCVLDVFIWGTGTLVQMQLFIGAGVRQL
jgi:crotonobetainyl-CoA:carnitine CoA-transferase CaiB-like acyl-CoA transferase